MRGGRMRVFGVVLTSACLAAFTVPSAAAGVETKAVVLRGATADALVIDLDGDGSRDVVRLATRADGRGVLLAEVWVEGDDGWRAARSRMVAAPGAAPVGDLAARLMAIRGPDGLRAVAVVSAPRSADCCAAVVEMSAPTSSPRLLELTTLDVAPVNAALVVDLDGDAIDELVLRTSSAVTTELALVVHARAPSGALAPAGRIVIPDGFVEEPLGLADSDGLPGHEIGLLDRRGEGRLARVRWSPESGASVEITELYSPRLPRQETTEIATMDDGRLLVVHELSAYAARWPSGGQMQQLDGVSSGGTMLGAFGAERHAAYVVRHAATGHIAAFDPQLRPIPLDVRADAAQPRWPPAYVGALDLGDDEMVTFAGGGLLVQRAGAITLRPGPSLLGARPLAAAGRANRWVPLLHSTDLREADPAGGLLLPAARWLDQRLTLAPIDRLLSEPSCPFAGGEWSTLEGAAASPDDAAADEELLVAPSGYALNIRGHPTGSSAHVRSAGTPTVQRDLEGPLRLALPAEIGTRVEVVLVTPGGEWCRRAWTVTELAPEAPSLVVGASPVFLAAAATVAGSADPGARVSVDGGQIPVADDGTFSVELPAGLVPRRVSVAVVDRLGRERAASVNVGGYVDWAGAAWLAAPLLLALVVGVMLVRGTPGPAPARAEGLEELVEDPD